MLQNHSKCSNHLPITLHFLHGFLGLPSDWSCFFEDFKEYHVKAYDLFKFSAQCKLYESKGKNVLIGYSLGGRIALQHLVKGGNFDAAVIISAHPGLVFEHEKDLRYENDCGWAERFLNEPWESVLNDWNHQGVLKDSIMLPRVESDYHKKELVSLLLQYSLGKQENLRSYIRKLNIPILWITGKEDLKFSAFGNEMERINKNIIHKNVRDASHRVPWDQPKLFVRLVKDFLNDLL